MKHGLNLSSNFKNIFQASKSGCSKNYGLGHKCSDFRRHSPHTFPKEINFDDQRIMVDNFRTAADYSVLKKWENSAIIGNCQISVKEVQSSLSIFAQKYLHKCEDTYLILPNKYLHI